MVAGGVRGTGGSVGAGKSVLARGLIRALAPDEDDVPSPSFTLAQFYPADPFPIAHFDLYRLESPGEVWELGLVDAGHYEEALHNGRLGVERARDVGRFT